MTVQYEASVAITTTDVTVSNTATRTSVFSELIDGGRLGEHNKLEWEMSGNIGFAANGELTIESYYAGVTISTCTVSSSAGVTSTGLTVLARLSGDGSANAQFGTIQAEVGIPYSQDLSSPVGWGTASEASGSDQTFEVKVKWDTASTSNSVTHNHSTLTLLGYSPDPTPTTLAEPTFLILSNSKLNYLDYTLRKSVYFYAPLEHDFIFFGYGDVTFARASASTATWRDGASHTVAAGEGRFEYDGEDILGLAINTGTETLTYSTQNSLNDSNTICWIQDGVYKSTKNGDTNPFDGSGVWTGTSGVNIKHIVKFNKVISSAENNMVAAALA